MKNDQMYFYEYKYWTLEEICEMYKTLSLDNQKKLFRNCLAHYTLAEILRKCDYDKRMIYSIVELAGKEAEKLKLVGSISGKVLLNYEKEYKSKVRGLINMTGKFLRRDDDIRINRFINGEWFLNNLVCLTMGSSFERNIIDDLVLINYDSLSEDECLAISDNFIRDIRGEKIVFYNTPRKIKK